MPPPPINQPPVYVPTPPKKKKGCGCFLTGCLVSLALFFVIVLAGGVAIWYGIKNPVVVTDKIISWSYQYVARPKIKEMLPPNMSEEEKQRILENSDFVYKKYFELPPEEKQILFKEIMVASYYYSQNKVLPMEKIPHLTKFIQENIEAFQKGQKKPSALGEGP